MNESDMEAMITAAEYGRKRFVELLDEYGLEVVMSAAEEWMEYAERMLRKQIARVPDGKYYVESWLDDDGKNWGKPLKVAVTTTIEGDNITIDLTGSAPESADGLQFGVRGMHADRGKLYRSYDLSR